MPAEPAPGRSAGAPRHAGAWLTARLLSQAVDGGVVQVEDDGTVRYASEQAVELLGGEAAFDAAWERVAALVAEHRAHEADAADLEDVPGASDPLRLEVPVEELSRPVELRVVYHVHEEGGLTVVLQDRRSLDALEGALRLSLRMKSQSEHLDQVAHDLKAPLNALTLNVDLVRRRLDGEGVLDVVEDKLDVLDREIARLARMVQATMTQVRLPSEAVRSFECRRVLREVATLLRPLAKRRGVATSLHLPDERVTLVGVRDQFKQAVVNLAMNAIEAMTDGGTLELRLALDGDDARLDVVDDGPGIPPATLARVFKLYFTTKDEGSGLGLFTSRASIQRMGGTLELESTPGVGTVARVRVPVRALDREEEDLTTPEGDDAC